MKRIVARLLGIILALIVTAWLIGSVTAKTALHNTERETWPAGLGTLASARARVWPQTTNDAARQLVALAKPLQISFDMPPPRNRVAAPVNGAVMDHLKAEHARAEATIGAAPAEVVAYLAAHQKEIDAVRDHLLRAETIQWDFLPTEWLDAPVPNLVGHMSLARLLTVRALEYGRAKDPRAWDDLHAAWRLGRSLETRPEIISQMIFLSIARSVNAVAWKLPQPEAPWFAEVQNVDHRQLFLRAHQHETWVAVRHSSNTLQGIRGFLAGPYFRWSTASFARHQRETAVQVAAATACAFDGGAFSQARLDAIPRWNILAQIATPNLGAMWQRMFRTMAEREATANALRIAHGQPIVAKSACSDGAWKYENGRLSFSRDLPKSNNVESAMPLSLAIPARATPRST